MCLYLVSWKKPFIPQHKGSREPVPSHYLFAPLQN